MVVGTSGGFEFQLMHGLSPPNASVEALLSKFGTHNVQPGEIVCFLVPSSIKSITLIIDLLILSP